MTTELAAFAEATDALNRRTGELAYGESRPAVAGDERLAAVRSRLRDARKLRQAARRVIGMADDLSSAWFSFLMERRYYTRDEERHDLDHFVAVAREVSELVAQGRTLCAGCFPTGGEPALAADLDRAGQRVGRVLQQAGEQSARASEPWQPRDPERYAEAMRRAGEPGVSAEVVLAELRRRAAADRTSG